MGRKGTNQPTAVELEILQVVWGRGPSTVRQIHDVIGKRKGTGYSTTLKMVQVMTEKGILLKDSESRPQIYSAAIGEEETETGIMGDILGRVFGGSIEKLMIRALGSEKVDRKELDQIKGVIEAYEQKKNQDEGKES